MTIIQDLGEFGANHLWIKRDDLLPFSFGGNKARKARLFFQEIDKGGFDCVVTYGSSSSNHCRIVSNECCKRGIRCYIISPEEDGKITFNSRMMDLFGAEMIKVPVSSVHETINAKISELEATGRKPYFIEGGGHGNIGTEAYYQCYQEIREQEKNLKVKFDYVFLPSGTGTTQAGLVCGQLLSKDDRKIVGISIARKNPRGRNIVLESVRSYIGNRIGEEAIDAAVSFVDDYTSGYGTDDPRVKETIGTVLKRFGIPLDATYTGKAFFGMTEYLKNTEGKNILFLHTGGTPLFFDYLESI